jgi:hypothetical protein
VHAFELFSDPEAVATKVAVMLGADPSPVTEPISVIPAPAATASSPAEAADASARA